MTVSITCTPAPVVAPLPPEPSAPPPVALAPPPDQNGPATVLEALVQGDPQAWTQVMNRHRGLLLHVTRSCGLDAEQREDVLQTTWLRLLENAARIRQPGALTAWLVTTATREAITISHRERRERPTELLPEDALDTPDVDDDLDARWWAEMLRAAVTQLPARERALVEVLLEPEQHSYAAISARLGMPVGAIGPVRQRALRHLHVALPAAGR